MNFLAAAMRAGLTALSVSFVVGCTSFGPETVPGDQFNYNAAIAESLQQQLLVNLVRLRYYETPVFLTVNSMISQYGRTAAVSAGAGVNTGVTGDDTATIGGSYIWSDRPTITYAPVTGQEFSENLLVPIAPRELFGLVLAGWPAELVFGVTVWSINDLDNDIARPSRRRQADPGLKELLGVWNRMREAGVLGVREAKSASGESDLVVFLRDEMPPEIETDVEREQVLADMRRFAELLRVDPAAREFRLRYGRVPERSDEILLMTGSIWDIMLDLAWQFEVPPEHVESGRTREAFRSDDLEVARQIRIRYSKSRPADAFVAVRAHGYWFYIDQNDRDSKHTFSFLQLLLNLAQTATPDRSPVITISN